MCVIGKPESAVFLCEIQYLFIQYLLLNSGLTKKFAFEQYHANMENLLCSYQTAWNSIDLTVGFRYFLSNTADRLLLEVIIGELLFVGWKSFEYQVIRLCHGPDLIAAGSPFAPDDLSMVEYCHWHFADGDCSLYSETYFELFEYCFS